jgi:mRNA-degrading endonuclease RelE of RelBE toxin-antitoxin system
MNIAKIPKNVKVHDAAWQAIREIKVVDKSLAARIIQRIAELGVDPTPFNVECESKIVQNLKKEKIDIRRLRCMDIADYRIFYAVRKSGLICVYTVVYAKGDEHDEAYNEDSFHYKLIKLLYTKFWRECQ